MIRTSLVGSYAQPDWLIDREKLRGRFPPRVRARELWRVDPAYIEEAHDDATRLAIADQERAGLSIITDGEMRRESYSNRFATALEGVDIDNPGTALDRSGHPNPVPRVVGPIARKHPVQVRDLEFLKAHTSRTTKITVPGPFTMSQQAQDDYFGDPAALGAAYADAVREEILDLFAAGADIVQVDEPYMQAAARSRRAQYGAAGRSSAPPTACRGRAPSTSASATPRSSTSARAVTRSCPSWRRPSATRSASRPPSRGSRSTCSSTRCRRRRSSSACSTSTDEVETPETVANRIRRAFPHTKQLIAAPDCGMKYLPRAAAYGKLESLVEGARLAAGY